MIINLCFQSLVSLFLRRMKFIMSPNRRDFLSWQHWRGRWKIKAHSVFRPFELYRFTRSDRHFLWIIGNDMIVRVRRYVTYRMLYPYVLEERFSLIWSIFKQGNYAVEGLGSKWTVRVKLYSSKKDFQVPKDFKWKVKPSTLRQPNFNLIQTTP